MLLKGHMHVLSSEEAAGLTLTSFHTSADPLGVCDLSRCSLRSLIRKQVHWYLQRSNTDEHRMLRFSKLLLRAELSRCLNVGADKLLQEQEQNNPPQSGEELRISHSVGGGRGSAPSDVDKNLLSAPAGPRQQR